jgi:small subunit ribosomal protein S5
MDKDKMDSSISEESLELEESVINVRRCAKVVKGGKRFSFNALVAVGDRKGKVGIGYAKAGEVPFAVRKAVNEARKNMISVNLVDSTIPHQIDSKYGSTKVMLKPAPKGTGIKAANAIKDIVELAGITDITSKIFGSTNPLNIARATLDCLVSLRKKDKIESTKTV